MNEVLTNECGKFLKSKQDKSNNLYSEIFGMDFQGCVVGESNKTSDYWQGDEDKFSKSFNNGMGAIFVDQVKFDESSQTYSVQISLPIVDTKTKKVIGAITIGINMDNL
ncbi:MAG: hypothetical protein A2086_13885 [Spirochaetes bacterium GWD1_27_9]|nr:MAG: hypothetical protein A2Z98_14320 [Spirochaetes bacterium GWB1_27_13]OHD22271.1 MAG: hypothetical protein A2Y34_06095 [Spirochaetes bacterium GWC1_27_15]OHD44087.1 MAG: hypothetical protein A2086_13885 [Spirochaetes bacterium GWD1_27_9]